MPSDVYEQPMDFYDQLMIHHYHPINLYDQHSEPY